MANKPRSAHIHPGPGFQVRVNFPRLDPGLMRRFREFPTPDISDQLNRLYAVNPEIRLLTSAHQQVCGPACTVKVYPGDNLMVHKALDVFQPGDIVIVDAGGSNMNAVLGDLVGTKAKHRGVGGFVVDGLVRDLPGMTALDVPVFARGTSPIGPLHRGPGEINYSICCGGVVVNAGDLIVGDAMGVVVVPQGIAAELLERLVEHKENNRVYFESVRRGDFSNAWVDRILEEAECPVHHGVDDNEENAARSRCGPARSVGRSESRMTQLLEEVPTKTTTRQAIAARDESRPAPAASHLPPMANPPVVLLGGEANALSVARALGKMGVKVYALNSPDAPVRYSRYCQWIKLPEGGAKTEQLWTDYLLSDRAAGLHGAIVLACSDAGIQVIARNREAMAERYRLDDSEPSAQVMLLDKLTTYQQAVAAGTPTPKFWVIDRGADQLAELRDQLVYPMVVKPRLSHVFEQRFGKKYLSASSFEEVAEGVEAAHRANVAVLLMEYIPGGDDRLSSYFTYIDEDGAPLFHFTKRVIRRFPNGMGGGCYHITDRIPALIEPSLKLLAHVGLRGLANIEYKYDERDGKHKLIECNARFVGSNCLVRAAGFDLAAFVYNRLTNRPQPPLRDYQTGLRMWDPMRDFAAFLERRRSGELTLKQWLKSIAYAQTFAYASVKDPLPAITRTLRPLVSAFSRVAK